MTKTCFETINLSVSYHEALVLENANLEVPENVLAAVVGPNGAGKSTLLKASLGLTPKHEGESKFWGEAFENKRKKVAYIPQRGTIDWDFPTTVLDVVLMGLYVHKGLFKRLNKEDKHLALSALETVDLLDFKDRQISQLSGGQQQRVFIARALVQNPDLFLMDEPFAGVDAHSEQKILAILKKLVANKKTILVVHHDLETVRDYFDYVVLLNKKVKAFGYIKDVFTHQNLQATYGNLIPNFSKI